MNPSGPPPPQGVVGGGGYLFGPPPPSDGPAPPYAPPYAPPAPLQSDAYPDGVPPPAPGQPGYAPPPNPAYPQPGMAVVAGGAPTPMPMAGGYLPGALPPHTAVPMGGAGAPGGVPSYTANKYGEARFDYNNAQWRDVWAAVLFLVHLVGMGVLAIYLGVTGLTYQDVQQSMAAVGVDATNSTSPPPPPPPPSSQEIPYSFADWAPQLALGALAATAFAFLWMHLVRLMPRVMLWISLFVGFAMTVVLAGLMFAVGDQVAIIIGAFLVLAALLQLVYLYFIRHRIPFAAALMSATAHILRMFPSTILVAYFGLLLSLLWMAFWILAVSGAMSLKNPGGWAVLLVLSFYWTMEVTRNVVHVTVAGTVATYYFQRNSMPANPTSKSLGRACTKSFGSICFGSLLVAIIQTIRYILECVKGSDNEILVCIAECILACIQAIIEFFNKYAYIQIAIYGKPFMTAARDTWTMLRAGGLDLIIQDDLTGSVVGCGAFVGGLVAAAVAAWLEWNKDPVLVGATAAFAFIAGMLVAAVPLSVFDSAVGTLYVCYAEDPSQLQRDDPALYNRLSARMGELEQREQRHYNSKHQPQSASASKPSR